MKTLGKWALTQLLGILFRTSGVKQVLEVNKLAS